jgi:hypothetical protein
VKPYEEAKPRNEAKSLVSATLLVPHIPFVILHPILTHDSPILILISPNSMMLLRVGDIAYNYIYLALLAMGYTLR